MADRVEVVIDFSEYPVGTLVVLRSFERNGKKPAPHERGLKDTVTLVRDDEVRHHQEVRRLPGRFMMHCHNPEGEDRMMMARFEVV